MTIAVLGSQGMLGRDCVEILSHTYPVIPLSKMDLDITNPDSVDAVLSQIPSLDIVINCAAYTDVDGAESHADTAFLINGTGPQILAEWCHSHNVTLVHFSTDYVFKGMGIQAYRENDPVDPINRYGASKWAGENAIRTQTDRHYIFRIQWLYGRHGKNFVTTIRHLLLTKPELNVVNDQVGALTWTRDIATTLSDVLRAQIPFGTYHLAAAGEGSWYDVTCHITRYCGLATIITPVSSSTFPRPAPRPHNSRLNCEKLWATGVSKLPRWDAQLSEFLAHHSNPVPHKPC